jgi:murein DD-endopeptidase MepM/ murein hydrolase activator NlpD
MLASEDGQGSPQLWTELIGSQLHARKAGETLYARITAGSGYGRQGERSWSGRTRPVSTDQEALPMHRSWAREVLSGLHTPRFESAIAFFDPAQQDKAYAVAQRARVKQAQGLPLTEQEKRLSHYRKTAAEVRADWQKTLRRVGTIDGVEFYEMNRSNPEKYDFAARDKAKRLGWPVPKDLVTRIGDGVTDSRPGSGRPHKGVDIFAPAGSTVTAARSGRVKRVIDGRSATNKHAQRAGLWVDVEVAGGQIDRYLHLGEASVSEGQRVKRGDAIGVIAEAHESGSGDAPHVHFEVRASDYDREKKDYGQPINPKFEVV